jgi:site-specific recombinase XerC
MVITYFRRQLQIGAQECAAQLGNEFLAGIAFIAPGLAPEIAGHARRMPGRMDEFMPERGVVGAGGSPWVFPSKRKKRSHISYFPVAKQFSKTREEAKIPKGVVLYSARHSFATDMLDHTGNIVLVGKLLGHRSVTTTQRYLHPDMKGVAGLVNARNATRAAEQSG